MSPQIDTLPEVPPEMPPATMETLMAHLGVTKANTTIVGSATNVQEEVATEAKATSS